MHPWIRVAQEGIEESQKFAEHGIYIRSGIVVVVKDGVIKDGFKI